MAQVIVQPTVLPVDIETVKSHLRIDTCDEDALITAYMQAATTRAETITGRALITQTIQERFRHAYGEVALSRWPVQSVVSVAVRGAPVASSDYELNDGDEAYMTGLPKGDAVIVYVAGYGDTGAAVPAPIKQWIMAAVGTYYENREAEIADSRVAQVALSYLDNLLDAYITSWI